MNIVVDNPLEGVSVRAVAVGFRRTHVYFVNLRRGGTVEVTITCSVCGRVLERLGPGHLGYYAYRWVDLDACEGATLRAHLEVWLGDGWDALRALVDESPC